MPVDIDISVTFCGLLLENSPQQENQLRHRTVDATYPSHEKLCQERANDLTVQEACHARQDVAQGAKRIRGISIE